MSDKPVLLVVYDTGSLAPTRLAEAARDNGCSLVFVTAGTDHAREMIPTLETVGSVVDAEGRTEAELVAELRALGPAGIITFSEFQIAPTVRLADALGLRYHRPADVDAITHKDLQRQRFAEAGVDSVRFRTITGTEQADEALAYVGLPAIIKPVIGASSRNTQAVATAEECHAALAQMFSGDDGPAETAVMLEELLVGRETPAPWGDYIAVDCVADGDDVRPVFVTSKFALAEPFRERGGYGGFSVVPQDEELAVRDLACRAVRALNIHGVADVEIKLTAEGPRVIEVNGRLGAWVDDLAIRSGTSDPARVAVAAALGLPYETPEVKQDGPIAFHYLIVPPVGARKVASIRNVSALRRLPDVDRVTVLAEPGAAADWRIGARGNTAAVIGSAANHRQLAATVAAIENVDWITYE
ncbi:ATP-grasp domain-containing protein [Streptomyces sp. C11-1]|uniref:ATP-grasp domain-containing protein n=1 Tax=Streptomyces durocortorensis TaxID=2811104 RepID=A0ABY9VZ45_9ACTN|nr:ATP-grasp domain-containing protein [Streptomyces durocortorensis]WNF29171.1 ATP-grasp domain-containing protein [Streptomyces durocortorensis]